MPIHFLSVDAQQVMKRTTLYEKEYYCEQFIAGSFRKRKSLKEKLNITTLLYQSSTLSVKLHLPQS
jgi:hypothetical protein